jgi:Spy/CpxP family protein refolding chaperone
MNKHLTWTLLALITLSGGAAAQTSQQPYAGQQDRTIKAMSADMVQGHLDGRGLGYAKAAELNHYPGPLHIRQLAAKLDLSAEKLARIAALELEMKTAAKRLGRRVVASERALDQLFASGKATAAKVTAATVEIGGIKGELRAVHLNTHLKVRPLLTAHQVMAYDRLRGYGEGGGEMKHGGGMSHGMKPGMKH